MGLTLYLVRHGRTVYNDSGLMQGWSDSPLTDGGLAGVRATAEALAGRRFTAAWSSPSGRTVTTAREILAHHPGIPLTCDDGLREFHFGDYEATPEAAVWARTNPREMFESVFAGTFPGLPGAAEDGAGYLARVGAAFARIEAAHRDGGEVLVVSHGVTLLTYLILVDATDPGALGNARVSVVTVDGTGRRRIEAVDLAPEEIAAFGAAAPDRS